MENDNFNNKQSTSNNFQVPPNELPPIQQYQYQQYQSNQSNQPRSMKNINSPMRVKDWIITQLLLTIPIANIILLFIWAFDSGVNENKKNYCRAQLIIMLAGIIIFTIIIFFIVVIGLSTAGLFNNSIRY